MHELSLMASVLDSVFESAQQAGATQVVEVKLSVGEMTEVVPEAIDFAFEALTDGTIAQGATLTTTYIKPRSRCLACGNEFEHDRFHISCPACNALSTELLAGRELFIDSIEVDIPDNEDDGPNNGAAE